MVSVVLFVGGIALAVVLVIVTGVAYVAASLIDQS